MFNDANSDPTLPGRLVDRNRITGFLDLIIHDYNSGKDVRIKPSKRGTFTKAAK
jgi:hypothetical protein